MAGNHLVQAMVVRMPRPGCPAACVPQPLPEALGCSGDGLVVDGHRIHIELSD